MKKEKDTYDLDEYLKNNEKMMNNLVKITQNQNHCIKEFAKDNNSNKKDLDIIRKQLDMIVKDNRDLQLKYNDLSNLANDMKNQLDIYDRLVNTIGFTGEDVEISKTIRNRCFKFVKKKDSDLYYLFYKTYSSSLSASLKKEMQVRKYSMIHTTKYNDALKFIESWKPSEKIRTRKINELVELNASNKLNKSASGARVQIALERYLSKTEGGTLNAIQ